MNVKKWGARLVAMVLCLLLIVPAVLAEVTQQEALQIAKQQVPASYKLFDVDRERTSYEFEFRSANKKLEYEVTIDKATGKVLEIEFERRNAKGGTSFKITQSKAKKLAKQQFPGATVKKVTKQRSEGCVYKVKLKGNG